MLKEGSFFANLAGAWEQAWPRPRVIVASFPHNPTTACVDLDYMARLVEFARERDMIVVHDFAYADLGFDGYDPPSILQVPGAKDVAIEFTSLSKTYSMAGWRMGFAVGNAKLIAAMEGMSFDTPKGKMTFRKEDHQAMQSMYHFKIKVDPAFPWGVPELIREIKAEDMQVPIRNKR